MKDISKLTESFDKFVADLKGSARNTLDVSGQWMFKDAKDRIELPYEARNIQQFVDYANSLKKTEVMGDEDDSFVSVYSDLVVQDGSKWDGVPIGAFLEWGTGPLGDSTNSFEHGYPYTLDHPWDAHTAIQWAEMGTWGIAARPHLYPALIASGRYLYANMKDETEKTWNR